MWDRVEEVISRAPSIDALRLHGVELLAAKALRARGEDVPAELREEEREAAMRALAAPVILRHARAAYGGGMMLIKGPQVAARFPDPAVRSFRDLDLIVDDAPAAQRALREAGFVEVGDPAKYEGVHHLRPLLLPGLPLSVELHREANHAPWLPAIATPELLSQCEPSATGVEGLLAPVPAAHAIVLAAHSWAHMPLRRLLDLIDIAVVLTDEARDQAARLARRWGYGRVWSTTLAAADALLLGGGRASALRVWARHLVDVRERTVLETHLAYLAAPACGLPRGRALSAATVFASAARPRGDERWPDALRRTSTTVTNAFLTQSAHDARTR